ncbi:RND family efflux transporter MFP subunit [Rhodoblastus acidophilus]|nr:RND family efflux transporter MFP subunit [Rhodoblastus acidophilus]
MSDYDEFVGRFNAVDFVEIRARVSGYLQEIDFKDGQFVKKGDPLFKIDPRPYQIAADQARGALNEAKAKQAFARTDLDRGKDLVRGSTITQQSFEQRVQTSRSAEAATTAQDAAVRQAELDIEYTDLTAPIAGRIGDRRVSVGNLVTGGAGGATTLLATIASIDPIRLEFTVDEGAYLRFINVSKATGEAPDRGLRLPVKLRLLDEKTFSHEGRIDFVDNVIDRNTGTIRMRATVANPDGKLTPGMFARVRVQAAPPAEKLLVPDVAVGTEQARKFVYVVDKDDVARMKYVTLGPVVDGLRVIETGLDAQDRVVTEGLMRVKAEGKVSPQVAAVDAPSPAAN